MAKRIPFSVIFATDEDSEYPSSELNSHGPAVVGWRSKADSTLEPKEIILRFDKPAIVCRIQVLAHQFMIPERVELWIHYAPKGAATTPSGQTYDYLGFIALSDNSSTGYKSRELQSVPVGPKKGTHLKLRFGAAQKNDSNQKNQLALIAVNVLGESLATENAVEIIEKLNNERTENALASICDDLSFSMYVEESIVDVIRDLEQKKLKAVDDERFEYARKLKLCMSALKSAGERLGRYSLAKRQAVQQEDFIAAKLRKEQIEMYKKLVFDQLQVNILLETDGAKQENDSVSDTYAQKPSLPSPPSLQDVATSLATETRENSISATANFETKSPIHAHDVRQSPLLGHHHSIGMSPKRGSPNTGSLRRRNKSAPRSSFEDYEERAVPALRHSHTNEFLRECQGAAMLENDPSRGRSRLNDRERRQAALPLLVFGNEMVELFYSRQFQDREEGLMRLTAILKGEEFDFSIGVNKIARSATLLLHRAVRDAVFSVFNHAAESVRALFMDFAPNRVSASEIARCVDRLLPELLAKSGDPSPRIHTLAQHTILCIASCPEVQMQNLVAPPMSRSISSATHPRLALSRLQMLEQLVLSQGISTDKQSGLTCRVLTECGCSGLHHPAEPVRKVAERILLLVYMVNPRLVRKQLPPDDDITRRNLLYRQLFTEFDKIDAERRREFLDSNRRSQTQQSSPTQQSPRLNETMNSQRTKSVPNENSAKFVNEETNSGTASPRRNGCSKSGATVSNGKQLLDAKMQNQSSNSTSFDESVGENRCPFCDWTCTGDLADQLDKHYWKACPLLTKCPQCSQVLEVAALNVHLLEECEAKIAYVSCDRCKDAVHKDLLEIHKMEDHCVELATDNVKCPLCHEQIDRLTNGTWKEHLAATDGCAATQKRRSRV